MSEFLCVEKSNTLQTKRLTSPFFTTFLNQLKRLSLKNFSPHKSDHFFKHVFLNNAIIRCQSDHFSMYAPLKTFYYDFAKQLKMF